jgi:hypothetical protein
MRRIEPGAVVILHPGRQRGRWLCHDTRRPAERPTHEVRCIRARFASPHATEHMRQESIPIRVPTRQTPPRQQRLGTCSRPPNIRRGRPRVGPVTSHPSHFPEQNPPIRSCREVPASRLKQLHPLPFGWRVVFPPTPSRPWSSPRQRVPARRPTLPKPSVGTNPHTPHASQFRQPSVPSALFPPLVARSGPFDASG